MNMLSVIRCFIKGQIIYNTAIYTYIDVKKNIIVGILFSDMLIMPEAGKWLHSFQLIE